jgi:hypothetical protein
MKKTKNKISIPMLLSFDEHSIRDWLPGARASLIRQMWRCPAGDVVLHFSLPSVMERIAAWDDTPFFDVMVELLVDQGVLFSPAEVNRIIWSINAGLVDPIVTVLPTGNAMTTPLPPPRTPMAGVMAVAA